jgi:hypothetical protein
VFHVTQKTVANTAHNTHVDVDCRCKAEKPEVEIMRNTETTVTAPPPRWHGEIVTDCTWCAGDVDADGWILINNYTACPHCHKIN